MTRVRFFTTGGSLSREVEVESGISLLEAGQAADQPLEGTCEGQMACSTCHVYVLNTEGEPPPPPSEEEEDMLDFAYGASARSRLSCQLRASKALIAIDLQMPGGAVDMST